MGWIISFVATLLFLLPAWGRSLLRMNEEIEQLSKLDHDLGNRAELLANILNPALRLNSALDELYAECSATMDPYNMARLQAEALVIAEKQNLLLMDAQTTLEFNSHIFRTESFLPQRMALGPCALQGKLICLHRKVFSFATPGRKFPAGVVAIHEACREIVWQYSDPRVRTL